jgi:methylthioribose-1-phosphate isomerase
MKLPELVPLRWQAQRLVLLDQTRLPNRIRYVRPRNYQEVISAIQRLAVRGAPLIGVAGAYGLVREACRRPEPGHLRRVARRIARARPTAVNLAWAIDRLVKILHDKTIPVSELPARLEEEAQRIHQEEKERSIRMGRFGAGLIRSGFKILTICNAGKLAAPGPGTALAAIYTAQQQGKRVSVFVPETRPLLQGARLTAFELSRAGIPVTMLTDSMLALVMPEVDIVLVGADRIARNGDTANKVGTYQLALLARSFRKPFYPVAAVSTFDFRARTGQEIPIEQREPKELMFLGERRITPKNVRFYNPAFDVTPARLVTGIITDQGILKPPFAPAIRALAAGRQVSGSAPTRCRYGPGISGGI